MRKREFSSAALYSERSVELVELRCLLMAVRLKLRIKVDERSVVAVSLLNSGYEAPTPQLLIPVDLARRLDLWPPHHASEVTLDTAGGPLRAWIFPGVAKISVLTESTESRETTADIIVSPLADEPLINDKLADELEIAVESFGKGLWRFSWEPKEKLRKSESR